MKSEIMDLDSMELMDVVKELYRLLAADVPCKDEIPWLKCIGGCTVDENKEVISLTCLHSVCSNKCVSKLKKYRLPDKKDESHCCPICELEVAPEDLQRRVVPSQVFIKKTDHTDIVLVCENCVLDLPAVAYCVDCPACLCQQCKKMHPVTRSTRSHGIQDSLEEKKRQQIETLHQTAKKCPIHDNHTITHYCSTCFDKICKICVEEHTGHNIFNIANKLNELEAKAKAARELNEKCERAKQDLRKKLGELNTDWSAVNMTINMEFANLIKILLKRQDELKKEAKRRFLKKCADIKCITKQIRGTLAYSHAILKVRNEIASNCDEIAAVNFLTSSESTYNWLAELDKKLGHDYDLIVENDWHFNLDVEAGFQVAKSLREFAHIEYSFTPKQKPAAPTKTYAGAKKPANVSDSSKSTVLTSNSNATSSEPVLTNDTNLTAPRRRIAVKSTGQLSVTKVKTNSATGVSLGRLSVGKVDSGEADRSGMAKLLRKTYGKSPRLGNSNGDVKKSNSANYTELQQKETKDELKRTIESDDLIDVGIEENPPPDAMEVDFICSDAQLPTDKKEGNDTAAAENFESVEVVSVPLADAENDHSLDSRPTEASPDSCVSSHSDKSDTLKLGLGKRERKKKSFPEFLDTDQSLKLMRQQNSQANSSAKRRHTSGISTPKKQRLMRDDVVDSKNVKYEMENGQDYESSCEDTSDTEERRSSLRKRPTADETPSDVSSPVTPVQKRGRGRPRKHPILDTFEEAPLSTIEELAEFSAYPVQGKAKMKITNNSLDENDDYCSICLDGGEELIVCCDGCPKVFHLSCHIPPLKNLDDSSWECNYCTTKAKLDEIVSTLPEESEDVVLVPEKRRHFVVACKFLTECYGIPEMPTMRWTFPIGYRESVLGNGKVPYHLKYIHRRLTLGDPKPFTSVLDFLMAFRQMFIQALSFYKHNNVKKIFKDYLLHATNCFNAFLKLVKEYYPLYLTKFDDVHTLSDV